jgi:hypothetical protein
MLMVRMQIHMSPATHAALQKRAHEDGVSASELVRQGIELRLRLEQGGEYRSSIGSLSRTMHRLLARR